ncbi:unnamed protein product [Vitrella brassicaformis CCMP3155]|uniref:Importin subunit alpha n=1 Tax=Vitrella brassicaformis (strain CCMP3155) TaxID=1169540 RepID=A0A0G4GHB2_VITBC|nr:unnamed protein product [Vitrella brassicaformis CCMP3155]|eukprot:CEM29127.1 unnamed protein product [Vitrella brassicaformis CCMP3155]
MESAANSATEDGHPSPQAVLDKASSLYKAIRTKKNYDQTVEQRGSEAVEAEITGVMADIRHLIASASDPLLRMGAIYELVGLLSIEHIEGIGQKAVDVGLLPVLIGQLGGPEVQTGAARVICLLAVDHAEAVVNAGAVPPLVQLVSSHTGDVRLGAIDVLRNITAGSATRRDAVLAAGILEPLLRVMQESSDNSDVPAWSARLLCNLWSVPESDLENQPVPVTFPVVPLAECVPFVPVLAGLIAAPQQDNHVMRSARRALAHFAVLSYKKGTDADRDALVECGAVASIKTLLEMAEPKIKAVACLVVYFVAEGTTAHKQAVIDGGLVPLLIGSASGGDTGAILKMVAARVIGRLLLGSQQQIEYVVECGGIQPICVLLDDVGEVIGDTISVLDNILSAGRQKQGDEGLPDNPYCTLLEQAGGVDKLADLQTHTDILIAARAIAILANHFRPRVDEQRLNGLIQAGVIQAESDDDDDDDDDGDGESDGAGDLDTDSGSDGHDSDSDGEGEGEEA